MKRNLLSIIILALLVVNIVLTAIMMVSVSSASKKTAELAENILTIVDLEINGVPASEQGTAVSMENTAVYNISEEMTIPLKSGEDGVAHYAVGNVSLSMDTTNEDYKKYGDAETMATREGLIKDIVFGVIGKYTKEEMQANSSAVKQEILTEIQNLFDSEFIYGISYNFLYS